MKRRYFPGLADIVEVDDPSEISKLASDPSVDRQFDTSFLPAPINWLLLRRATAVLSVEGRLFPTMRARRCPERARAQEALRRRLNDRLEALRAGPAELEPLAQWVRGAGSEAEVRLRAQELLGRLFRPDFVATEESWKAAQVLVSAPRSWNLPKVAWWIVTGTLRRAKRLLADKVGGDLSGLNAVGIAVHNLTRTLDRMRELHADPAQSVLSPENAVRACLRAPASVYRQATTGGELARVSFSRHSLFVLDIGRASQRSGGEGLVFMENGWSACPASRWVPAMLEGVWKRAGGRVS